MNTKTKLIFLAIQSSNLLINLSTLLEKMKVRMKRKKMLRWLKDLSNLLPTESMSAKHPFN